MADLTAPDYAPQPGLGRALRLGVLVVGGFVLLLILLGAVIQINGAVVAPGELMVESNVKLVQHPTGGVVSAIPVKNGDRVEEGQVLMTLDPTISAANASIATEGLDKLMARQARLTAERDGRATLSFPPELLARAWVPEAAAAMRDERSLLQLHLSEASGQKAQLRERATQTREQIVGLEQQRQAREAEITLIEPELSSIRVLWAKRLVPITRLNGLEREAVRLRAEVGQLTSAIAESRGRIAEIQLAIGNIDQQRQSEAGAELNEVQARIDELRQRKVTADDSLSRIQIRAPQAGVVDKLQVHTIGGVIAPGETIMTVVPVSDELRVQCKVSPMDIDQVRIGQHAEVRFSAFSARVTPAVDGEVTRVSADVSSDERTGQSWYVVTVQVPPSQMKELRDVKLVPGMPAETFIQTHRRSLLSFITKPVTDQAARAFRTD